MIDKLKKIYKNMELLQYDEQIILNDENKTLILLNNIKDNSAIVDSYKTVPFNKIINDAYSHLATVDFKDFNPHLSLICKHADRSIEEIEVVIRNNILQLRPAIHDDNISAELDISNNCYDARLCLYRDASKKIIKTLALYKTREINIHLSNNAKCIKIVSGDITIITMNVVPYYLKRVA